jgi:hypothetical protein
MYLKMMGNNVQILRASKQRVLRNVPLKQDVQHFFFPRVRNIFPARPKGQETPLGTIFFKTYNEVSLSLTTPIHKLQITTVCAQIYILLICSRIINT